MHGTWIWEFLKWSTLSPCFARSCFCEYDDGLKKQISFSSSWSKDKIINEAKRWKKDEGLHVIRYQIRAYSEKAAAPTTPTRHSIEIILAIPLEDSDEK